MFRQMEMESSLTAARLTGLLADRSNLLAFAAIVLGAGNLEELVATTGLEPRVAERSISHLVGGGLVLDLPGLEVNHAAVRDAARTPTPELHGATAEQAAVLRNFVDERGRLIELPARAGRRRIVLEYLAGLFEPGLEYDERKVNETLRRLHDDYATTRRYLVDEGLLDRDAGVYRRVG